MPEGWFSLNNLQLFAIIAFVAVWVYKAMQVWIGGAALERIVAGLRGGVFESYRQGIERALSGLSRWIGDEHPEGPQYLSGGAYLLCLGIAVVYPLLFLLVSWSLLGGSGKFAGLPVLPPEATQVQRLGLLLATLQPVTVVAGLRLLKSSDFWVIVGGLVAGAVAVAGAGAGAVVVFVGLAFAGAFAVAGAVAGAGAGAVAGAVAFAVAGAVAFAVAVAVAVAGAVAFAVAGAVAFAVAVAVAFAGAVAVAVAVAVQRADRRRRGWFTAAIVAVLFVAPALVLAYAAGGGEWVRPLDEVRKSLPFGAAGIVLFLALLPAVNAPFDWLSLGVTRWLLSLLARLEEAQADRLGTWIVGSFLGLAVIALDVVIAVVLSVLVVAATAFGTALFSQMHVWAGGNQLYDVVGLVNQIRADPANPDWWWVYAMIFSTLIPTVIHFVAFAGMFATITVVKPWGLTRGLAESIERAHSSGGLAVLGPSFWMAVLTLVPGIGLLVFAYEYLPKLPAFDGWIVWFGGFLADLAINAARFVGG